ncbi:MAG: glutamate 5-kinase, partial [Deltaproteobacteria bacterium]|nr:glutamate 5-kinase [Deltaproteobacteria bacterium]
AVEMAASFGIQAHIVYGKEPDVVPRIMAGESIGTCFLPTAKRLKSYHQWLRFGPLVGGRVMVDSGARKALGNNKSLLTAGISGVDGGFGKGEIVDIFSQDEEKLGVGLVNYSAEDLRDIIAQKNSADRPPKSAESKEVEAIHKDRMVLVNGG